MQHPTHPQYTQMMSTSSASSSLLYMAFETRRLALGTLSIPYGLLLLASLRFPLFPPNTPHPYWRA